MDCYSGATMENAYLHCKKAIRRIVNGNTDPLFKKLNI